MSVIVTNKPTPRSAATSSQFGPPSVCAIGCVVARATGEGEMLGDATAIGLGVAGCDEGVAGLDVGATLAAGALDGWDAAPVSRVQAELCAVSMLTQ